jgi:hypothetical protein
MQIAMWHVLAFVSLFAVLSAMIGLIIKSSEHAR